ncbi:hypothetical protein D3C81_1000980 [compost metagenome]
MARHALHAEGEDDGQHRRQAFGNRRHRQADGRHQHLAGRVVAPEHADRIGQAGEQQDGHGELAGETLDVGQQRRLQAFHPAQQAADVAQLGLLAGGHHHAGAVAGTDQGAGIGHAVAVAEAGGGGDGGAVLVGRQ